MKYKVNYTGFAYVNAHDADEAEDKMKDDETVYSEMWVGSVEEVDDFEVDL